MSSTDFVGPEMPALLISTSMPPSVSTALCGVAVAGGEPGKVKQRNEVVRCRDRG
jgi:hypothetical protein